MMMSQNANEEAPNSTTTKEEAVPEMATNTTQKVPFAKLFAFADGWDYLLMTIGSLGACAHGASVPVFFIFFGKLINIIGIAYLFPTTVSHRVAMVSILFLYCIIHINPLYIIFIVFFIYLPMQYSLDFVYLATVILFSSWAGMHELLIVIFVIYIYFPSVLANQ